MAVFQTTKFGYLTGQDIIKFCPIQLVQKEFDTYAESIQQACDLAYSELEANLNTRYDIKKELSLRTTYRNNMCVKIVSILAIRNILGSAQNISEKMLSDFSWCDKTLANIRNGQISLVLSIPENLDGTQKDVYSDASLVSSSFYTLG